MPVMSEGIMSGVNWIRRNDRLRILATVLTSSVLASPGTPTSRTCPRAKQARQELLDDVVLADDHLADLAAEPLVALGQGGDGGDLVARGLGVRRRGHGRASSRGVVSASGVLA